MAQTTMRLLTRRRVVTCAASAKALFTASALPEWKSRIRLPGASSWIGGASDASAAIGVVTAGSSSMSSSTISAASLAWASVSATTKATGSPTQRTFSVAREWRTGVFIGEPSRLGTGIRVVSGP